MQTYLKNGYIVSMDQQDTVFDGGGVLVEDDRITAVGKVDPRLVKPDAEVIDLQGKYVLPGFVNTHVHTPSRFPVEWAMMLISSAGFMTGCGPLRAT